MLRKLVVPLVAVLALALAACAPTAAPATDTSTAVATTAPTAAAVPSTDTPAPSAASAPTAAPTATGTAASPTAAAQATIATAVASAGATPSAAAATGAIRLVVVPADTVALFRAREQLASKTLPSDAIGKTNATSGTIVLTPDGKIVADQSKFTVDVTTLQSDSAMRDGFIKRSTLQVSQYPSAEFDPTGVQGLPSPLPASGDVKFQLLGNLTVHGVTKPVTWDVTGTVSGSDLKGTATTAVTFEQFGMTQPKVSVVLSVEDTINLEIDFHLALSAG